ncbi:ShlB/FhaC/HecB family hemolysin secretion/activation protein [Yoonia sp. BS5-3]|uniref:ShlB/FhaC/HecB family hemolysin secretion/activation protein n=1 Tax=Yoonia phaeophyticola TaxID=3137369 RepID=A0ABZ2V897_9RHOB
MMRFFPAIFVGCAAILTASAAQAQLACIPIDTIDVAGTTLLTTAEINGALAPFEGACLDLEGINAALEAVTFLYVDRGYVTARAYLPEQNIADRSLDITVVEGELSAVRFNGEERPIWEAIVFPSLAGKAANLREIEQGLEIIRGMPAYNATMEISAGAAEGQSILEVTAIADKPWTARVGIDNQGTPGSGQYQGTVNLTYDHLLGLNESWALNLSRGTEEYPFSYDTGGAASESAGLSVRFPYGRWAFETNYQYSGYETDTLGPITAIGTDGWTHTATIGLSRVMHRNQISKTILSTSVEWRENVNRIAEIQINASSRTLASARLDLEHERAFLGGSLTAALGYEQGLDALGAEVAPDPLVGPNAQFELGDFTINYFRPWQTGIGQISYSGTLRGQYSEDVLYGNYQFGVGGFSSVRGVNRGTVDLPPDPENPDAAARRDIGIFRGSSGAYWRNDLIWVPELSLPADLGALQIYAGLDAGIVDVADSDFSPTLVGSAVGMRLTGGTYTADFSWQQLLSGPENFDDPASPLAGVFELPDGLFVASLSMRF